MLHVFENRWLHRLIEHDTFLEEPGFLHIKDIRLSCDQLFFNTLL